MMWFEFTLQLAALTHCPGSVMSLHCSGSTAVPSLAVQSQTKLVLTVSYSNVHERGYISQSWRPSAREVGLKKLPFHLPPRRDS